MLDLAQRAAEGYMGEHPEAIVTASGGGWRRGVASVVAGTADLGLLSGEVPDELDRIAAEGGVHLVQREVYRDAVVVVVHPQNPLSDLPLAKLRDVFRGAVASWKQLGGKDEGIVLVSQEASTAAYETFKRQVMGDGAVIAARAMTFGPRDLVRNLSLIAIGYVPRRAVGDLKVVSIDGVLPSAETLASGKYPLQRPLSVAYRADAPEAVTRFVDYLLAPDKGQAIVRAHGDVPVR
jgi:phosphate transport system substrate-binding protein